MTSFDELVKIAIESSDFRQRLLDNAEAAAREAGVFLPSGTKLVVHQNAANEVHFVIDDQANDPADEDLQLLNKAQQDPAFKARLMSDPATAIRAEIGVVLPASLKISVHENTSTACHVVLPSTELPSGEMTDLELEGVAGGTGLPRSFRFPHGMITIRRLHSLAGVS
ncbi:MAG: NHLP leader peptide family natural product precursor [Planctomycetia bacterium]|nr:NHLP leader peptide family natural product precursor [Planctomycetia bacterium]